VRIIAATGLKREAQILAGPGVLPVPGGGRSAALEAALAAAAAEGASGLISIGIAGALADGLSPGDWVVAEAVIAEDERVQTDAAWRESLLARLPRATPGVLLGSEAMLTEAAEKRSARLATGALAVDMESHVAARIAQRFGLRFAAARVISDAADRSLPAAVKVGMRPDGGMALGPVLAALARDPRQLASLIRTGLDAQRAFQALEGAGRSWIPPSPAQTLEAR
jgi:hopanoid-associated phosphorylase